MKTKFFSIVFVAAIAVAAAWNVTQSKTEVELSDLALANVEALASEEDDNDGTGKTCYNSITTGDSELILYCGTCTYLPGRRPTFYGTSKCGNSN
jgi:hypothetical protein